MSELFTGLVQQLIGSPPVGFEYLEYLFSGAIMIMLLKAFLMLFQYAFKIYTK